MNSLNQTWIGWNQLILNPWFKGFFIRREINSFLQNPKRNLAVTYTKENLLHIDRQTSNKDKIYLSIVNQIILILSNTSVNLISNIPLLHTSFSIFTHLSYATIIRRWSDCLSLLFNSLDLSILSENRASFTRSTFCF